MLDETRRGMIVAECGTGKTLMGMLTIHQHAQRSVRKGGCNGNYRAIVLCPDHLIKKWKDELEETIPGVKVTIFDAAGKGCKHLISDMTRLYDRMRGPNGRWRKPQGAEWYILGRDQAKFLPARSRPREQAAGSARSRPARCSRTVVKVGEAGRHADDRVRRAGQAEALRAARRRFLVEVDDEMGTRSGWSLGGGSARRAASRSWTRTAPRSTSPARRSS